MFSAPLPDGSAEREQEWEERVQEEGMLLGAAGFIGVAGAAMAAPALKEEIIEWMLINSNTCGMEQSFPGCTISKCFR